MEVVDRYVGIVLQGILRFSLLLLIYAAKTDESVSASEDLVQRPNVLFISVDDLNDWIGCMGGHPQSLTPNFDRLAKSGVLFTNAHCVAPACNPSRTAVFSGISPNVSGLYRNEQTMRHVLPDAKLLPEFLSEHGYRSVGSGKLLHYVIDARSWDDYFPAKEKEDPFAAHLPWGDRPKSLPRGGPWQYVETDWHAFNVSDEEFGGDVSTAKFVSDELSKQHEKPFFLACGIYRPHEPWFNPKHYFDLFPVETIQLPLGYRANDLDDVPGEGVRLGRNRYFDHIRRQGQWKEAIRAYLASIAFADANLGRVLDALESGPNRNNTIVVLWSDHGWHLGEKQHWQKFTGWRVCTRVPLMIRVPPGTQSMPDGTSAGTVCDAPVDLLGLFRTIADLCGLQTPNNVSGHSLLPLMLEKDSGWDHLAYTFLGQPGAVAISGQGSRYIRYQNGDEELYDTLSDPHEWNNVVNKLEYQQVLEQYRESIPRHFAPLALSGSVQGQTRCMQTLPRNTQLVSMPIGNAFHCVFRNATESDCELFWVDRDGQSQSYGLIAAGGQRGQTTRTGAVWIVRSLVDGETRGVRIQANDHLLVIQEDDESCK